ncbi:DUF2125 domain-containing protein [Limibaculum sp. FT325]|uniref:DUF2125 domain-containing protein n=1 Tax=Thermohalobaculum sediminis TaxID=2939436 RepID=UPI0020BDB245|nr:DUF2125 domain-containing protein [Limibaculum sediminis]MCL5777817.1 DUF2125 domain-containing protein [Limibaculum sediminis]
MVRALNFATLSVVLAAAGWVAWWMIAARGQEAALARWFESRAAEGWQAEMAAIATTGFPSRFDTLIRQPALSDPDAGWAWSAPELRLERPALDPTHVTAEFPSSQTLAVPGERASVESREMTAVLALFPGIALQLREGSVLARGLAVAGQSGWRAGAELVDASVRRRTIAGEPPETHELEATAERVLLPEALMRRIDPSGVLSPEVSALRADALFVPDRPLDRAVIEEGRIGLRTLVLRRVALDWDGMGLTARGRLDADAAGLAEGEVALTLNDWRRMIAVARTTGALSVEVADAVEAALGLIAIFNGSGALDVTVSFAGGRARIGPVPVGPAPRLLAP